MTQQPIEREKDNNILNRIYEGMAVYDHVGAKVGTVKEVYLGSVTAAVRAYDIRHHFVGRRLDFFGVYFGI